MKKIGFISICVLLLAVLLLAFSGCGSKTDTPTPSPTQDPTPSKPADQKPVQQEIEEPKKISVSFMDRGNQVGETLSLNLGTVMDPVDYKISSNEEYNYTFLGWDANGDGVAEEFPYTVQADTVFVAVLEIEHILYHYDIYIKDELVKSVDGYYGDLIEYPTVISSVSETETNFFLGWKYNDVYDGSFYSYLTSNLVIKAYFAEEQILKLYYHGNIFAKYLPVGEPLPELSSEWSVEIPMGFGVVWYEDNTYQTKANAETMIEGNLTLYGRNEPLDTSDYLRVTTPNELMTAYNGALLARKTTLRVFLDYSYGTLQELLNNISQNALKLFTQDISIAPLDPLDAYNVTFSISYSPIANSKTDTILYTQLLSANETVRTSNRSETFDDFAIDKLQNSYVVNNSEALCYVMEHGFRPIIDEESPELTALYEKMKAVLRSCVDDDMSDVEKARAIYEYLILSTVYDGALSNAVQNGQETIGNDSYYLEGVFNDHLAVCEGLSKAYVCLCRMEGIECVRVTGKNTSTGLDHSCNKVKIDGKWYVVDVTSGGTIIGNEEILSYKYFMITDAENQAYNHMETDLYSELVCDTSYDVYEDLHAVAHTVDEAVELLTAYINSAPNGRSTYEMCLDDSIAVQTVLDNLDVQVDINYTGTDGKYCFIYEKE